MLRADVAAPAAEGGARRSWPWWPMVARGGRGSGTCPSSPSSGSMRDGGCPPGLDPAKGGAVEVARPGSGQGRRGGGRPAWIRPWATWRRPPSLDPASVSTSASRDCSLQRTTSASVSTLISATSSSRLSAVAVRPPARRSSTSTVPLRGVTDSGCSGYAILI